MLNWKGRATRKGQEIRKGQNQSHYTEWIYSQNIKE